MLLSIIQTRMEINPYEVLRAMLCGDKMGREAAEGSGILC